MSHPAVRLEGKDVHPSFRPPQREVPLPTNVGGGGLQRQAGPGPETQGQKQRRGGKGHPGGERGRKRGAEGLGERRRERVGAQSGRQRPGNQQLRLEETQVIGKTLNSAPAAGGCPRREHVRIFEFLEPLFSYLMKLFFMF